MTMNQNKNSLQKRKKEKNCNNIAHGMKGARDFYHEMWVGGENAALCDQCICLGLMYTVKTINLQKSPSNSQGVVGRGECSFLFLLWPFPCMLLGLISL